MKNPPLRRLRPVRTGAHHTLPFNAKHSVTRESYAASNHCDVPTRCPGRNKRLHIGGIHRCGIRPNSIEVNRTVGRKCLSQDLHSRHRPPVNRQIGHKRRQSGIKTEKHAEICRPSAGRHSVQAPLVCCIRGTSRTAACGTYTVLHDFAGPTVLSTVDFRTGRQPAVSRGWTVQSNDPLPNLTDGNSYGVASEGGSYGAGTVFQMTPDHTVNVLYSFSGGADGGGPVRRHS